MALIYIFTIFLSAFLIFLVQPMVTKMLLPFLGGTSAVWNTSMVFYQLLLLAGYLYAHIGLRCLGAKKQTILHISLLILALITLPLTLHTTIDIEAAQNPIWWLLSVLLISVGLPFFLLSANAPLIQSWFARTTHKNASNPYFLYSASNFGSFIALLSYPFLIEPSFKLSEQLNIWSAFYVLFTISLISCAIILYKKHINLDELTVKNNISNKTKPTTLRKIHWIALAFIPASLMLGVTNYVTTDIASFPLLWIIPLALYLLTFVFVFSKRMYFYRTSLKAQIFLVPLVIILMSFNDVLLTEIYIYTTLIHFLTFFVIAMVCHGQLSKIKPSAQYLTEFFLWVSVGGLLGGMFNALLVPVIFDSVIEYHMIIILSCLFRPILRSYSDKKREQDLDIISPILLFAGLFIALKIYESAIGVDVIFINNLDVFLLKINKFISFGSISFVIFTWVIIYMFHKYFQRPVRFALTTLSIIIAVFATSDKSINTIHKERNFFGAIKVRNYPIVNINMFMHGTTLHGIQKTDENRLKPTSYYSAIIDIFNEQTKLAQDNPVAILGLGVGTIACLGGHGQEFDFYEIDEAVEKIARNRNFFTYLSDCPPNSNVIIGDGRIEIAKADNGKYGLIIMDAFSSDSVPVHLLTSEAIDVYLSKLTNNGIIALHITNNYVNLEPIISSLAKEKGLAALIKRSSGGTDHLTYASSWVILAKESANFLELRKRGGWRKLEKNNLKPWTDDYSNILEAIVWERAVYGK